MFRLHDFHTPDSHHFPVSLVKISFFVFFFLRFYLFIHERPRERERESKTQAEGEAGPKQGTQLQDSIAGPQGHALGRGQMLCLSPRAALSYVLFLCFLSFNLCRSVSEEVTRISNQRGGSGLTGRGEVAAGDGGGMSTLGPRPPGRASSHGEPTAFVNHRVCITIG